MAKRRVMLTGAAGYVAQRMLPDRSAYRQHFKGADAIIHCGRDRARCEAIASAHRRPR